MAKPKIVYSCQSCGYQSPKWMGKCPDCNHHFPPTKMLKHGEEYVCEACHEKRVQRKGGAGARLAKVLVVFLLVGAIVGAMAVYALDLQIFP